MYFHAVLLIKYKEAQTSTTQTNHRETAEQRTKTCLMKSTITFLLLLFLILATVALSAPISGDETLREMAIIVREELC